MGTSAIWRISSQSFGKSISGVNIAGWTPSGPAPLFTRHYPFDPPELLSSLMLERHAAAKDKIKTRNCQNGRGWKRFCDNPAASRRLTAVRPNDEEVRSLVTIFRSGSAPPNWCALRSFETINLAEGESINRRVSLAKERLLCAAGTIQISGAGGSTVLKEGQFLDVHERSDFANWAAKGCAAGSQLVSLSGAWGKDIAGCGIFRVANDPNATDKGDPVSYAKSTRVDSHYHDCDEYWLLLEGAATVVVGDRHMEMKPGDCLAIGMGHHHDMPAAHAPVKAVFFETTLEGRKRVGHLWNHTHGQAQPKAERV